MSPPMSQGLSPRRLILSAITIAGLLLAMPACSDKVEVTPGCESGAVAPCECPSGESGFQQCQDDNEWGPCQCAVGDMGDAGGDDVVDDVPDDVADEEMGPPPPEPPSFANIAVAGGSAESTSFRLRFTLTAPLISQQSESDSYRIQSTIIVGTTP